VHFSGAARNGLILGRTGFNFVRRSSGPKEHQLQVFVRDNNVEQALRVLKKKMQREGVFREMKRRRFYEKPSEQAAREKSDAVRRLRKAARKKAIFDGEIKAPPKKPRLDANGKPMPARPAARGRKF
jgi:small subunit ribosomal protein S21